MALKNTLNQIFYFTIILTATNLMVSSNIYAMSYKHSFNDYNKKYHSTEELITEYNLSEADVFHLLLAITFKSKDGFFLDLNNHKESFFDSLNTEDTLNLLKKDRNNLKRFLSFKELSGLDKDHILRVVFKKAKMSKEHVANLLDLEFLNKKKISKEMLLTIDLDILLSQLGSIRYELDAPKRQKIRDREITECEEVPDDKFSPEFLDKSPKKQSYNSLHERLLLDQMNGNNKEMEAEIDTETEDIQMDESENYCCQEDNEPFFGFGDL